MKRARLYTRGLPAGRIIVRGRRVSATGPLGTALHEMARDAGLTSERLLAEMLRAFWESRQPPPARA